MPPTVTKSRKGRGRKTPYSLDSPKIPEPIDISENTPDTHLSTTFSCTQSFDGRLTPLAGPMQHVLDFSIKNTHLRYKGTTGLRVFYLGAIGERPPILVEPPAPKQPDLYLLNSRGLYEIRNSDNQLISKFSFIVTKLNQQPPQRVGYKVIFH